LHIAIDASRCTTAARTGTENYALQLIRALLAMNPPHQFTLYFRDQPQPDLFSTYPNVKHKVIPFARAWTHLRFAAALFADRPDVTFVPAHTLPLLFPGRAVATIHDLGYRFFPDAHPVAERLYLNLMTRFSAGRAHTIIADSIATKRDLVGEYGTNEHKIEVVYPGVDGIKRVSDSEIVSARSHYRLPSRYLLFLGTLQPRKNIQRLIEAFLAYGAETNDQDLALVLAGKRGWLIDDMLNDLLDKMTKAQRERIVLPGYIDDDHIGSVYSGAVALAFPSLYEGFGFPVLEAMRCGVPVLCSNTSSLPELAGEAAVLVDPLNVQSICDGIEWITADKGLRDSLVQKGYQQAAKFSWEQAAVQTLGVLEAAGK
jgi:glycosyltransferase involved in cell wall biosynthesis